MAERRGRIFASGSLRPERTKVVLRLFAQFYHGQQGPLLRRLSPRPRRRAERRLLGRAGGRGNRAAHDIPAERRSGTLCDFIILMITYEASLTYQLINFEAADSLATTKQLLAYLAAGIPDHDPETFWVVCMNPKRRPICRTRIASGILAMSQVSLRDVWRVILLAEAKAFAVLRTQYDVTVRPSLADGRLSCNLRETARLMNVEFIDYLIARVDGSDYYSCRDRSEFHG
ncbi:MAG: JAB domain-containing protein [Opitutus sp.]